MVLQGLGNELERKRIRGDYYPHSMSTHGLASSIPVHTCTHTHTHKCTYTYTYAYTNTNMHAHTHTHMHTYTRVSTRTYKHMRAQIHTFTNTHMCILHIYRRRCWMPWTLLFLDWPLLMCLPFVNFSEKMMMGMVWWSVQVFTYVKVYESWGLYVHI